MNQLRRLALLIDSAFENFAIVALLSVVCIMSVQVFTRKLANFVFFWSEEGILLSLVWFAFMGIAVGFREGIHMGIDALTNLFGKRFNRVIDIWIELMGLMYGIYFLVYGWEFTVMMMESTLPATKLPNAVVYAVMPISGFMVCVYSLLHLMGIDTKRHKGADLEIGVELEEEGSK